MFFLVNQPVNIILGKLIISMFVSMLTIQGFARYTHGRGPWELVHSAEFQTRALAMTREKFLKSGQGRLWLKEKLDGRARPPEAD
jgi:hypothetical protein